MAPFSRFAVSATSAVLSPWQAFICMGNFVNAAVARFYNLLFNDGFFYTIAILTTQARVDAQVQHSARFVSQSLRQHSLTGNAKLHHIWQYYKHNGNIPRKPIAGYLAGSTSLTPLAWQQGQSICLRDIPETLALQGQCISYRETLC